jgi:putative transposase
MKRFQYIQSYRNKTISAGAIYHITQRAPGKEMLFIEKSDYLNMLSLLKEWIQKFKLDVFAFCLMPNHYHILLRINEPNLSEAMHSLNTTYGMRFNTKYCRKGHVFCGVYRASLCLDDVHLIGSSIYIHLNPQKAGIVKDALNYRWSSISLYTNSKIKSFVDTTFILKIINDDLTKSSILYKNIMKEYSGMDYENIMENPRAVINFAKSILKKLLKTLKDRNIKKDFIAREKDLDKMIEEFKNNKRKKKPGDNKSIVYLIEQLKSREFNMTEIAKFLNISRKSLYKLDKVTNKVEPQV